MKPLSALNTAEDKVNLALLAFSRDRRQDMNLHKRLVDDLARATNEFLEVREQVHQGK